VEQLLVVKVGDRWIGWRAPDVAEVFAPPPVTPLPEPLPHLLGATFLRGRLLTVADTASLVGAGSAGTPRLLVRLAPPREHLAFSIDTVEGVLPYNALDLREESQEGLWAGLYPWGERWIPVLRAGAAADALGVSTGPERVSAEDGEAHGR